MGRFLPMKLAALLLLLLQTPKPLDPTVATCQELVFTSRDEVDELMLQIRQFAGEKRPSSGTPVGTTGPIQVIRPVSTTMAEFGAGALPVPSMSVKPRRTCTSVCERAALNEGISVRAKHSKSSGT